MDFVLFDATLDRWAADEAVCAEKAKANGDERGHSIALMKKSMYSTMLKTLGHFPPEKLANCAMDLEKRREKQTALHDADSADRISIQLDCIKRVQNLIAELGGAE